MKRRILSMLLVLMMLLSIMPTAAFADKSSTDVVYNVESGKIYFNKSTGEITDCDSTVTKAVIPSEINGTSVMSIGNNAFWDCSSLTSIKLPNSVKSIGKQAFYNCTSLTSITLPNSVKSIGDYAFDGCSSLTSINIPNSVTSLGDGAFTGCMSLTSINVASGNSTYSSDNGVLFDKNKRIIIQYPAGKRDASYVIPNSVKSVGGDAFYLCESLKKITLPNSVTSIGDGAFSGCSGLTSINIPNSVKSIGDGAFIACSGLTSINIPNSVKSIGDGAFGYCTSLKSITLPNSVKSIGGAAFEGCKSLTSINIPNSVTSIVDYAFNGCSGLTSINIPNGVTSIAYEAFSGCSSLTSIEIPNRVTSIGGGAFWGCTSLESITLPNSVTSIGAYAFDDCGSLTDVYYSGTKEQWNSISIASYNDSLTSATIHYNSEGIQNAKINGEFIYGSQLSKMYASYPFSYDESWFKNSSTEYNHDLARMSMRMTMAGCGTSLSDKALYIKKLLKDLGFKQENIVAEYPTPTRDSIGYTLAYKTLADGSVLVSVVIRSGGYGAEWASNFTIGPTNEHQGFDDAAKKVVAGIEEYIANNDEIAGNVKFWVTGYSRGAATANLVAQKLDAKAIYSKNSIYEKSNIYAYCFECPRNMIKDKDDSYYAQFNNIFNIVNYADIVTKVAMPDWGYTRYGIDMNLPSPENTSGYKTAYEKMLKEYKKVVAKVDSPSKTAEQVAAQITLKSQGRFTDKLASAVAECFHSQYFYVTEGYEYIMRDIGEDVVGGDGWNADTLGALVTCLCDQFPQLSIRHPIIVDDTLKYRNQIAYAHFPELCLSWMDALSGKTDYASNMIREFKINCPVDVNVYDSNGTLVAQIINDEPIDIDGSYISAFVDENGQKVIVLPTDEEYKIELTATDNGTVSYQVSEIDTSTNAVERLVNYYDVEIKTGDVLVAGAEKTSDGTTAVYPLGRQGEGTVTSIEPTSNETGDVARIKLTVSAEEGGTASGGGIFNKGEFAKVTATADENSTFEGWYAGDEKVSDEAEYRFRMENDTDLIAKFHTHDYKNGKCECGAKDPDYKPPRPVHIHRYTETVTEPTCTEKGYTTYTCICGSSYVANYVDALGHTEAVDPAVAATCEKTGLTEGKHCSVCNEVLVAQKETPKTEHKFENGKCSVCGAADPNYVAPVVNPFKDVKEGDAFYDEILWAADKGIINGDGTGNYNPNDGITRAQIVMILWNAAGNKEASKPSGFADVKEDAWYAKAVAWAVENGITNGTDLGFEPDRVCTRAEIVTFLHRANNKPAPAAAASFTDLTQDWYKDAVAWAVENGITKGVGDNRFAPNDTCTRGQAAAFMYRLAQLAK